MSDPTNGVPSVPPAALPPAGWYDDGSGRQRYWNGSAWTDHFADAQPVAEPVGWAQQNATAPAAARKSRKGLWITLAVVGGLLLLALLGGIVAAAIGLVSRVAEELPDVGTPVPSAPLEETDEPEAEPEPEPPAGTETAIFGETWEYTDGLAVTISEPRSFEPSGTAIAPEAAAYVLFDVTIANGTDEPYEPLVITSMQSGSTEAEEVFDSENGLDGPPNTTLLPGREVTFQIGYGVAETGDLVLEFTPGFEYQPAIFVSSR
jgi:Protein of unknown function (DUF2510)